MLNGGIFVSGRPYYQYQKGISFVITEKIKALNWPGSKSLFDTDMQFLYVCCGGDESAL